MREAGRWCRRVSERERMEVSACGGVEPTRGQEARYVKVRRLVGKLACADVCMCDGVEGCRLVGVHVCAGELPTCV